MHEERGTRLGALGGGGGKNDASAAAGICDKINDSIEIEIGIIAENGTAPSENVETYLKS